MTKYLVVDQSLRSPSIVGGALRKVAVIGLPLGRELSAPIVAVASGIAVWSAAVAIEVSIGITVWTGEVVAVVLVSTGDRVDRREMAVGVMAKIAVCVRLGVGNVKGVGEAAPGNVHAIRELNRRIIINTRKRIAISASGSPHHMRRLDCTLNAEIIKLSSSDVVRWGGWDSNPHEYNLRGF